MTKYLLLLLSSVLLFACGPAKLPVYETVGANETAFVLPLEGDNLGKQKQFKSIEYLESKKVAAKRIMIPTKKFSTGRLWMDYKWEKNSLVIKVDRAPVTREWTSDPANGTSNRNEILDMESLESIEFGIPLTVTAYVKENNTAKFLYYYAGKQLHNVIDLNVRSFCQAYLSNQFGSLDLKEGRRQKNKFIKSLFDSASVHFDDKGITIDVIGAAGGMNYKDKEIQTSINEKFQAEIDRQKAKDIRLAAEEFALAAVAQKKKLQLEMDKMNATAELNYSTRWNGELPKELTIVIGDNAALDKAFMAKMIGIGRKR